MILRRYIRRAWRWIVVSIVAYAVGWQIGLIGVVFSTGALSALGLLPQGQNDIDTAVRGALVYVTGGLIVGSIVGCAQSIVLRATTPQCQCNFTAPLGFKANFYNSGYESNRISLVYGVSDVGTHIRITWSDGHVETQPLENNTMLVVRAGLVEPTLVEALNAAGEVQARETFTYQ
jgi:hypothetical protein